MRKVYCEFDIEKKGSSQKDPFSSKWVTIYDIDALFFLVLTLKTSSFP